ncbi:unnamed protein product [Trichobilharzia regenti]|nr:unnamed protein product [Trichobilharzia regenti]
MFSKPVLPTPPLPLPPSSQQQQQQPKNSHVPPVINSLKPRNQTTISQLAQLLQERGIVSYRSRGMPSGATHLYPGSHPLLVSSTPSSIENHKSPTEMNDVNTSDNNGGKDDNNGNSNNKDNSDDDKKKTTTNEKSVKGGAYHSPLMVEVGYFVLEIPFFKRPLINAEVMHNAEKIHYTD